LGWLLKELLGEVLQKLVVCGLLTAWLMMAEAGRIA